MTQYLVILIIFICWTLLFCGLFSLNIVLRIMKKSNQSGESKSDFSKNTKQPMRIHVFTLAEYYKDMQENPDHYGVIYYKKQE